MTGRLVALAVAALLAQSAPPGSIEIVAPSADAYVSGAAVIHAEVVSQAVPTSVLFFVDGRQVCATAAAPFECAWDAGVRIVAHQIRVVAELPNGRRLVRTMRTKGLGFTENVDVDVVQLTLTVIDDNGRFVRDLPQSAFHVREDGTPQSIAHFAAENVPLELVVAIDISGSMAPALPRLKEAARAFLGRVPDRDEVTLLGFNDNIFTLARRAKTPAERLMAVDRLSPWGGTALYDVVIRGTEMLGRQSGRRALIVFTDGEDQGSHATIGEVERRLQASDVTLYMIGQGQGIELENLKSVMQWLTAPTGGRALFTDNIDQLQHAFEQLLDELSNQYLIGYASTNESSDERFRKIAVEVDGHDRVRVRRGYRRSVPPK